MRNKLPRGALAESLAKTLPTLRRLTSGLSAEEWIFRPGPDEWSATEIICHLRDVDREVHLPRLLALIAQEDPFMPGVVADDWAIERDYQAQHGPSALVSLASSRAELLDLLPDEGDPIWQRHGRHTFFGPTTFWELVCLVLEHDELHIEQVRIALTAASAEYHHY